MFLFDKNDKRALNTGSTVIFTSCVFTGVKYILNIK